ncbi:MAG: hypothetical protein JNJ49_08975 [Bdellovibrionaceae bacterium]|nr:hypothetical protein [Pseudobdellovibrionaceae bacterium]
MRTTSIELSLINIAASLGIGIWIPLRLVFFDQAFWVDIAIELSVCALFLLTYHRRIARTVKEKNWQLLVDDPGLWILGLDILAAVPIVGILYPLFGKQALFFFVFKLLMLRHLFTVREILDLFDSLHPIAARLIPLGFIVPVVVHLVSCGWVFLGAGTGGLSGVRSLDYIRGVYWAVTTLATVGYGDISPKTPLQMAYASLTMIVGVGFFGYVLSNVASLLARMDAAREEHLRHHRPRRSVHALQRSANRPSASHSRLLSISLGQPQRLRQQRNPQSSATAIAVGSFALLEQRCDLKSSVASRRRPRNGSRRGDAP